MSKPFCGECEHWEPRGNGIMGDCLCDKFEDQTDEDGVRDYTDISDGLVFWGGGYEPGPGAFVTGRDFGCVHFKPREGQ